jgi:hypothetical protein
MLGALVTSSLGWAPAAQAAEPLPPGIALDGLVVVAVSGGPGIPLPDVDVILTASVAGVPFQTLGATTDDAGRATFAGVGRPTDGPAVTLVAHGTRVTQSVVDGCTFTDRWSGAAHAAGAAGQVDLPISASLAATIDCPPPGPTAPTLAGVIRDVAGGPIAVATAWVSMERSDGATWTGPIHPTANGSFVVRVQPWGTDDEPADLVVRVLGVPTSQRVVGDCRSSDGPLGALSLDVVLAEGFDPDPVIVETRTAELSGVCGVAATPGPAPAATVVGSAPSIGPSITPPPTDAAAAIRGATTTELLPALVVALGMLALLLGWELVRRDA